MQILLHSAVSQRFRQARETELDRDHQDHTEEEIEMVQSECTVRLLGLNLLLSWIMLSCSSMGNMATTALCLT